MALADTSSRTIGKDSVFAGSVVLWLERCRSGTAAGVFKISFVLLCCGVAYMYKHLAQSRSDPRLQRPPKMPDLVTCARTY